jgi:hypothetical protein
VRAARAIVLTGGPRAFSAGADVTEVVDGRRRARAPSRPARTSPRSSTDGAGLARARARAALEAVPPVAVAVAKPALDAMPLRPCPLGTNPSKMSSVAREAHIELGREGAKRILGAPGADMARGAMGDRRAHHAALAEVGGRSRSRECGGRSGPRPEHPAIAELPPGRNDSGI